MGIASNKASMIRSCPMYLVIDSKTMKKLTEAYIPVCVNQFDWCSDWFEEESTRRDPMVTISLR
jgi:hypothetical protein